MSNDNAFLLQILAMVKRIDFVKGLLVTCKYGEPQKSAREGRCFASNVEIKILLLNAEFNVLVLLSCSAVHA